MLFSSQIIALVNRPVNSRYKVLISSLYDPVKDTFIAKILLFLSVLILKILAELKRKLQKNIAYVPSFMKHHDIQKIEQLWMPENKYKFSLWAPFDIILLYIMSKLMPKLDWQIMCENIITVKNNLPNNELTWKYRGELPLWF